MNFNDLFDLDYVIISRLHSHGSCKLADSSDPNTHFSKPQSDPSDDKVGYGRPPRHGQFRKGTSGFPSGRPKRPPGISIKEILEGDQRGKNCEEISRREAVVIDLLNESMPCNQKAYSKYMK